ncbi:MAG: methyltransferase [Tepidisphaeraceae bacterium]
MANQWTADGVLEVMRGFQPACVLAAAAELDVFGILAAAPLTASQITDKLHADLRGTTVLLDSLAALGFLAKRHDQYAAVDGVSDLLTESGRQSVLAMVRHQATCLRRWSELAKVVQTGSPCEKRPSIRGEAADYAAFVEAMDNIARTMTDRVVADLPRLMFRRLLDVGGATGSWTIAFLRAYSQASATLFDLPQVMPQAQQRLSAVGLTGRVTLAAGDFYKDPLPGGCDLAWVSAIVHQNSRAQNRELFAKLHAALPPGGQVLIRDILMEESRISPVSGAMFAVNMLVATQSGGTFTVSELSEDLAAAGFGEAKVLRHDEGMHAVLGAVRR